IQRSIEELHFSVLDKKTRPEQVSELVGPLNDGVDIGVMSEAGAPGVADPGAKAVAAAHKMGAKVAPLVGPSSFLLALMSSGFNGQSFAFHGYLPIDKGARQNAIRRLEKDLEHSGQTQMFMETPYRNDQLLADIISTGKSNTLLCIAADLTTDSEFIRTKPLHKWAKQKPKLHKRPTVFLIGR
ncbi:MAG TPA: SAM-dependent methyltransferase, partial [Cytophagales bacterium]|nr:SAM-dependent methyltransferase [Cytophagales bacterium]